MDKPWKAFERRIGKILGLPRGKQRVGPVGFMGFDVIGPRKLDVFHRRLGVEAKHTKGKLPRCITDPLAQARQACKYHVDEEVMGLTMPPLEHFDYDPICVFGDAGRHDEDILCVLSLTDYVSLREKAAAWEEDLLDIRGHIQMDCCKQQVGLAQWKEHLERLNGILDRYKKRGF